MFRQPASRINSAFRHFAIGGHKIESIGLSLLPKREEGGDDPPTKSPRPNMTAYAYAKRLRGTVVKMIAGQAHGLDCMNHKELGSWSQRVNSAGATLCPDETPDVQTALDRLDGFAFAGIHEAWALSVCLFHAVFGGECHEVEFGNWRAAKGNHSTYANDVFDGDNDATTYGGYYDEFDWKVYTAVVERFKGDLVKFNVTADRCRSICPAAPRRAKFEVDFDSLLSSSFQQSTDCQGTCAGLRAGRPVLAGDQREAQPITP